MTVPRPVPDPPDEALVTAWRRGEERAATELVQRHTAAVGRYLYAAGAPSADIEDLVQETFIKAFGALSGWRGEGSFRGWLLRIAGNLRKDLFRKEGRRVVLSLVDSDLVDGANPAGDVEAADAEQRLLRGIGSLPRLQREVFIMRAQQGMDYEEIAAALGTSPGAARVHYHHAVRRLKGLLP